MTLPSLGSQCITTLPIGDIFYRNNKFSVEEIFTLWGKKIFLISHLSLRWHNTITSCPFKWSTRVRDKASLILHLEKFPSGSWKLLTSRQRIEKPGTHKGTWHNTTALRCCKNFGALARITNSAAVVVEGCNAVQIITELITVLPLWHVSHGNEFCDSLQPTEVEGRAKAFSSLLYLLASQVRLIKFISF